MSLLNQLIAREATVKSRADKVVNGVYHAIQKTESVFSGISRVYASTVDGGMVRPPERTNVQLTVEQMITDITNSWVTLFDLTLTKDVANTEAKADVVVNGQVLIKDAPVPYLLWLEKRCEDMRAIVSKAPLLDPAENWHHDPVAGTWASEPATTISTDKTTVARVGYEATDKHPAQLQWVNVEVPVGTWTTIKFSGKMPRDRQIALLDRIDTLTVAVKTAREAANTYEFTDVTCGAAVLGYVFGASPAVAVPLLGEPTGGEVTPQTPA